MSLRWVVRTTEHRRQDEPLFLDRQHFAGFAQRLLNDQAAEAEQLLRPFEGTWA